MVWRAARDYSWITGKPVVIRPGRRTKERRLAACEFADQVAKSPWLHPGCGFKFVNRVFALTLTFNCSSLPHNSLAVLALKSSLSVRKILVRNVCSRVRHDSPARVERNELTNALRGHNRNTAGLTRQSKELFISGGVTFPGGGKRLILITEKQDRSPMSLGIGLNLRNASNHRPLKILFQHCPDRPCQPRIGIDGKVQGAYPSLAR